MLVAIIFANATLFAVQSSANSSKDTIAADHLFTLLADTSGLVLGNGWKDGSTPKARWEKMLGDHGLKKAGDETWSLVDQTGELRVMTFFLADETSFFLHFFPADQKPIPAPLLTTLLAKAESSSPAEANTIELAFSASPSRDIPGTNLAARETGYMTIRLQAGVLVRQSKIIKVSPVKGK